VMLTGPVEAASSETLTPFAILTERVAEETVLPEPLTMYWANVPVVCWVCRLLPPSRGPAPRCLAGLPAGRVGSRCPGRADVDYNRAHLVAELCVDGRGHAGNGIVLCEDLMLHTGDGDAVGVGRTGSFDPGGSPQTGSIGAGVGPLPTE